MLTVTGLLIEEPVQFTAGIKSLVSNKMNMKHPLTGLDQLKNELWSLRTGCCYAGLLKTKRGADQLRTLDAI